MAQAVAYLRLSPRDDDPRVALDTQRAAIEGWAAREHVAVVGWFEDVGISGDTAPEARPGLQAALGALRTGQVGILIVQKRDRLGREAIDAGMVARAVRQQGSVVRSTETGGPSGDEVIDTFTATILDAAAAYEVGRIRQRTIAGLARRKAEGKSTGHPPYGFRRAGPRGDDGTPLEPDESEQKIIGIARGLRELGEPLRSIADALTVQGFRSRSGKPFAHRQVRLMLKNDAARRPSVVVAQRSSQRVDEHERPGEREQKREP